MKVKIIKGSGWYEHCVGKTFEVYDKKVIWEVVEPNIMVYKIVGDNTSIIVPDNCLTPAQMREKNLKEF